MGAIGKKLRSAIGTSERRLLHWCPACEQPHGVRIEGPAPVWKFNGNYDKPTFEPSVLCFTVDNEDDDGKPIPAQRRTLCHYFIRDGFIDFCGDSPHKLAGQRVELPDWPYAPGTYGGIED